MYIYIYIYIILIYEIVNMLCLYIFCIGINVSAVLFIFCCMIFVCGADYIFIFWQVDIDVLDSFLVCYPQFTIIF